MPVTTTPTATLITARRVRATLVKARHVAAQIDEVRGHMRAVAMDAHRTGGSARAIERASGISARTVGRWLKDVEWGPYNDVIEPLEDSLALLRRLARRLDRLKARRAELIGTAVALGATLAMISRSLDTTESTVRAWAGGSVR
ncbi:hypothetical protein OMK64_01730 [Cellulomonas fimi]|uniref:hypothetical protein n=1 Tax=Cellulomonas fimi TaxID=1708 RepID=UPI00234D1D86|nr:hypothetical protein [Cellulomonas fimi]MDC7120252.1 hypothetical protein [Cellulomonas fimi]